MTEFNIKDQPNEPAPSLFTYALLKAGDGNRLLVINPDAINGSPDYICGVVQGAAAIMYRINHGRIGCGDDAVAASDYAEVVYMGFSTSGESGMNYKSGSAVCEATGEEFTYDEIFICNDEEEFLANITDWVEAAISWPRRGVGDTCPATIQPNRRNKMTQETKHTPTPWEYNCFAKADGTPIETVQDVADTVAASAFYSDKAELWGGSISQENNVVFYTGNGPTSEKNAAFIVRACNAHDALVEALKELREAVAAYVYPHPDQRIDEAYIKSSLALEKAGAE